ncbi:BMP family ABC transporter substrate-binding protein [Pleurocapsa sp. FMAR1]|uniref:BMP family ABC transporter substrate-binding protein n=1 Tax=Pleurocapsa sp. FMAR1 TaxID=3040204 RepID=UPI0029C6EE5E|nr:BMP family ABC transporter substrate-binding protein [Pleurocapsa sp. FMAR1]
MNKKSLKLSRRQIVRGILATTAFGLTAKFGTGCTNQASSDETASEAEPIVVGFIYVGSKDDFGYNQSHAEGAAAVAQLPGFKIVEQANVPETQAVQETMREMIEIDGAKILFPTSFGYFDPHILKIAEEFPEVQFFHAGGLYKEGMPENVGTYFGYIDEAQYIAGVVAANNTKTGKLGFVAAKPIPQVLRNINGYTLGAKSVNPKITTQVVFTGDWAAPVKEAEAVDSMVNQGADVITCHVDSPKVVIETASKRGVFCTGYHTDQSALAPKAYLTGAEWDWKSVYTQYANLVKEGKTLMNGEIPHTIRGGLPENFWKLSAYGPAVSEATKSDAEAVKDKFANGTMVIYTGELKDNQGKIILPDGKSYQQTALELETTDWLVDGVQGSV